MEKLQPRKNSHEDAVFLVKMPALFDREKVAIEFFLGSTRQIRVPKVLLELTHLGMAFPMLPVGFRSVFCRRAVHSGFS